MQNAYNASASEVFGSKFEFRNILLNDFFYGRPNMAIWTKCGHLAIFSYFLFFEYPTPKFHHIVIFLHNPNMFDLKLDFILYPNFITVQGTTIHLTNSEIKTTYIKGEVYKSNNN